MLSRWRLRWTDLDFAHGDIPAGAPGSVDRKGNLDIEDALRRRLGLRSRRDLKPRIWTAKRGVGAGAGSWDYGERWLYKAIAGRRFFVHARCARVRECFGRYDGTSSSEFKHAIDAVRYGLKPMIQGRLDRRRVRLRLR
jgi:hypothetical protein